MSVWQGLTPSPLGSPEIVSQVNYRAKAVHPTIFERTVKGWAMGGGGPCPSAVTVTQEGKLKGKPRVGINSQQKDWRTGVTSVAGFSKKGGLLPQQECLFHQGLNKEHSCNSCSRNMYWITFHLGVALLLELYSKRSTHISRVFSLWYALL